MKRKKIERILNKELEEIPWSFIYLNREDSVEIRNNGTHLSEDEVKGLFDDFLEDIEREGFKVLLEGKAGVVLEDDEYWLCEIDRDGGPGDKDKKIDGEDLEDIFVKSLNRVDNKLLPSNRLLVESDKIIDIYSESVNDQVFLNIKLNDNNKITLRSDGGVFLKI